MFAHKLQSLDSKPKAQLSIDALRIQAEKALQASQKVLWAKFEERQRSFLGVVFGWPNENFVRQRRKGLQTFLDAVATELVKPDGKLDISDSFAIDAIIERMHLVRNAYLELDAVHN